MPTTPWTRPPAIGPRLVVRPGHGPAEAVAERDQELQKFNASLPDTLTQADAVDALDDLHTQGATLDSVLDHWEVTLTRKSIKENK